METVRFEGWDCLRVYFVKNQSGCIYKSWDGNYGKTYLNFKEKKEGNSER